MTYLTNAWTKAKDWYAAAPKKTIGIIALVLIVYIVLR